VPFLGELDGYRIMLLEFPHTQITPGADKLIERLLQHNIRPLIAHPERNQDVMRDLSKIEPFVEMGCFLQMTAVPCWGFRPGAAKACGSVARVRCLQGSRLRRHNLTGRRPALREGMEAAARVIGEQAAHDLVYRNPRMILRVRWPPLPDLAPRRSFGRVSPRSCFCSATRSASPHARG